MDTQFEPLMKAAYGGDLATFKRLLGENPDLVADKSTNSHPSLFQFIVVDGGLGKIPGAADFAKFMIEQGAPLDRQLVAAASVNARDLVDVILDAGVSIEADAPWTALEETLYWAHLDMAAYLLDDHGAQITSLRAASELGDIERVRGYFDSGGKLTRDAGPVLFPFGEVSTEPQDVLDQAFLLALKNRQYQAADLLRERGANVNAIPPGNHEQCTPLHQAVYMNDPDMIDWLIARGAVADIEDPRFNGTAIGWARHFGHEALAQQIEAKIA